MPSPPIMDLGSGMDTQKTIKQLMDLERIPIHRMEEDNERTKLEIKAWEEVKRRIQKLEKATLNLHSFSGPFTRRSIVSSDPGAVSGEASASGESIKQDIEIVQLASRHQINSDAVNNVKTLPPGRFTVLSSDKKIEYNFRGGKLSTLLSLLKTKNSKIFEPSIVKVDSENEMIVLRSSTDGEKGELKFEDPDGLLQNLGIIKIDNEAKENVKNIIFLNDRLVKTENTKYAKIKNNGKKISVRGSVRYKVEIAENSVIDFTAISKDKDSKKSKQPEKKEKRESVKQEESVKPIIMGPEIIVSVGDIKLKGQQIGRELYFRKDVPVSGDDSSVPEETTSETFGISLIWNDGDKEIRRDVFLDRDDQEHSIDISKVSGGKDVRAIFLISGENSESEFSDLKITQKISPTGNLVAAHETEKAKDAILRINGVELKRPSNSNISDIIEGASLNLHRITTGPISVEAKAKTEEIVNTLNDWVGSYNDLLKFCRDNSDVSAAKDYQVDRPTEGSDIADGYREIKNRSGVFASDSTVRQLVTNMQLVTSRSYPSDMKPEYRVLSDIGISTGEPGFDNFKNNKYGLLEINEEKLNKSIEMSPLSVKELFASDTNDDAMIDNGVAFTMTKELKPYSRQSGGMISVRIDLLKSRITDNKDRISRKELSLERKEQSLRQKFGRMESSIKQSKNTGNFLKNQLRTSD